MNVQRRDFLLLVTLVTAVATPASGQTAAPAVTPNTGTPSGESIPDFSGAWNHASLNGLELPLSGPGPVRNRSRQSTGPQAGAGNIRQLVGDYTNPTLKPWAAEVVKKFGEMSLAARAIRPPATNVGPSKCPSSS